MKQINRRTFIKEFSQITGGVIVGSAILNQSLLASLSAQSSAAENIFVSKNGTPAENIAKLFEMRYGGIENFIGSHDVIVINPNGQWPNQGGTNCGSCMGLIDLILNRPGGFSGEILFVECTQFQPDGYWNTNLAGLDRNGPYNYNDMISYYHTNGHNNVNGIRIWRNQDDPTNWPIITSTTSQGWIRPEWTSPTSAAHFYLPYPVIRSPYSNRLVNLKEGIYDNGSLTATPLKFIKMPNLNNHGTGATQDYAGITSAVKSFLGIGELENEFNGPFNNGFKNMHTYADSAHGSTQAARAFACGESVGAWMTLCRKPDLFITSAEWAGWGSRTGTDAVQAKTVGMADHASTLDYYMSKYVLFPALPSNYEFAGRYHNPDYDISRNNTRQTIEGCISQGYGTSDEAQMNAIVYDFDFPSVSREAIDLKIKLFREGNATEQDVIDLINLYNSSN